VNVSNDDKLTLYLALDSVAEVFNVTLSPTRKQAYGDALSDLPVEAIRQACDRAIRREKFFPVPATLRELAGCPVETLSHAEAAWQALRNMSTRYNREALSNPITRIVFDAMGGGYVLEWGFGNWPLDQEDRKRREFLSRYREASMAHALTIPRHSTEGPSVMQEEERP
jgi:hypothetical protein